MITELCWYFTRIAFLLHLSRTQGRWSHSNSQSPQYLTRRAYHYDIFFVRIPTRELAVPKFSFLSVLCQSTRDIDPHLPLPARTHAESRHSFTDALGAY